MLSYNLVCLRYYKFEVTSDYPTFHILIFKVRQISQNWPAIRDQWKPYSSSSQKRARIIVDTTSLTKAVATNSKSLCRPNIIDAFCRRGIQLFFSFGIQVWSSFRQRWWQCDAPYQILCFNFTAQLPTKWSLPQHLKHNFIFLILPIFGSPVTYPVHLNQLCSLSPLNLKEPENFAVFFVWKLMAAIASWDLFLHSTWNLFFLTLLARC